MKYANINSIISVILSIIAFSISIEASRKYSMVSLKQEELNKTIEFYFSDEKKDIQVSGVSNEVREMNAQVTDLSENEESYYKKLLEEKQKTQSENVNHDISKASSKKESEKVVSNVRSEAVNTPKQVSKQVVAQKPVEKKEVAKSSPKSEHKISLGAFKNTQNALDVCAKKVKKFNLTGVKCVSTPLSNNKSLSAVYMQGFKSLDSASKVCEKLKSDKVACKVR